MPVKAKETGKLQVGNSMAAVNPCQFFGNSQNFNYELLKFKLGLSSRFLGFGKPATVETRKFFAIFLIGVIT